MAVLGEGSTRKRKGSTDPQPAADLEAGAREGLAMTSEAELNESFVVLAGKGITLGMEELKKRGPSDFRGTLFAAAEEGWYGPIAILDHWGEVTAEEKKKALVITSREGQLEAICCLIERGAKDQGGFSGHGRGGHHGAIMLL